MEKVLSQKEINHFYYDYKFDYYLKIGFLSYGLFYF